MKGPRKLLIRGLAVGLAALVTPVVGASPAQAAQSDCPANKFCLWTSIEFRGDLFIPNGGGTAFPNFGTKAFNDLASSAWNNSGATWCIYEHVNYGGRSIVFGPQSQIHDMRSYSFNDKASSARQC
ncbi:peptidase inhibitor family I36 protein [Dactylosporangium sp. NPDC050688]|uniref:peptidase inhibitor family I36 protein n=1 Tax=Dactylosporangium sp. NPDC050688 TaxID=3157217 RepID=UPI0033D4146C